MAPSSLFAQARVFLRPYSGTMIQWPGTFERAAGTAWKELLWKSCPTVLLSYLELTRAVGKLMEARVGGEVILSLWRIQQRGMVNHLQDPICCFL